MERVLEGRTALVTGSTSGIGLGIAMFYAKAGAKVMLNGFGKPEDIASACVFYASDDAAFVTGTCLEVDGGRCV
jgi:NAD(P)-dependent dehydrogenase (short-subunit alcohol dehydrogenase family)